MNKIMMIAAGAIVLGSVAKGQDVPPPPPTPVAVAKVAAYAVSEDLEPGAFCRVYYRDINDFYAMTLSRNVEKTEEWLASAIPVDQAYDTKASKFNGRNVANHKYDIASWEGVFVAKVSGQYVFTVNSGFVCGVDVNGQGFKGVGQSSFVANLNNGANKIKIWRVVNEKCKDWDSFSLDYRLATSVKPAKPITPSMLMHIVEDEEAW